jgi:transcription elongation factor GreA
MEDIKKALEEQIKQLENELTIELPAEIKKNIIQQNNARSSSTPV